MKSFYILKKKSIFHKIFNNLIDNEFYINRDKIQFKIVCLLYTLNIYELFNLYLNFLFLIFLILL